MVTPGWFFSLSLSLLSISLTKKKKKSNSPHTEGGPISERKKWKRVSVSQPCRTYRGAAAARALEGSAASRQEQPATPYMVKTPPPTASHSDSASPVGLEFWLPGKISVLGERGLSFACSHPSCATRKGPPYPPLLCTRNNLHWWSAFARVCLAGEAAAAPFFQGVGFRLGLFFSLLLSIQRRRRRSPEGFGCGCFRDVGTLRAASPTNTNNCHRFFCE